MNADTSCGLLATTTMARMDAARAARPCGVPSTLTKDQTPVPFKSLPVAIDLTESIAVMMVHPMNICGAAFERHATDGCTTGSFTPTGL